RTAAVLYVFHRGFYRHLHEFLVFMCHGFWFLVYIGMESADNAVDTVADTRGYGGVIPCF
ncbi:MAG: hypothetical protein MR912_11690, partial [Prevotella sp.]|nr:hypothetical protein [Prevotella sp.]